MGNTNPSVARSTRDRLGSGAPCAYVNAGRAWLRRGVRGMLGDAYSCRGLPPRSLGEKHFGHTVVSWCTSSERRIPMAKTMSIRIPEETAQTLAAVSRAEARSINQIVVDALDAAIAQRQADSGFKARLREMIAEDAAILEALAK